MALTKKKFWFLGGIAAGRFSSGAAEFGALVLAARLLGPSEYWQFSYFLAISLISAQLLDFGLARVLTIRASLLIGSGTEEDAVGVVYGTMLVLRSALVLALLPLVAWLAWCQQAELFAAGLCLGSLTAVAQCQSAILQSEMQFGRFSLSLSLPSLLRVVVLSVLWATSQRSLRTVVGLYLAAHFLTVAALTFLLSWKRLRVSFRSDELKRLFGFGKWLMLAVLIEAVYLKADIIALKLLSAPYELAMYAAAFTFSGVLNTLFNSLVSYYVPLICRVGGEKDLNKLKRLFIESADLHAMLGIPAAIGLWAVAPELFPLVFGNAYGKAIEIWPILVVYSGFNVINQTGLVFFALQKLHYFPLVLASVSVTDIVLCVILVPRFGAIGAAWAASSGMVVSLIVCWALTHRLIGMIPDVRRMLYYLASALLFFAVLRSAPFSAQRLGLAGKVAAGVLIYMVLLAFGKVAVFHSRRAG